MGREPNPGDWSGLRDLMYWIGFDVGGTFIDLFAHAASTGRFHTLKVPSSRDRLPDAVAAGIHRLLAENKIKLEEVGRIVHGTTVVINQLVERRGARVGVVTTRGFRDVLEIGRMRRPSLYDLYQDKIHPLAPRDMRLEVTERINSAGEVQVPLDLGQAREAVAELRRRGAEAIAVCLLNSYANRSHEEAIGELCAEAGIPCSISSAISAEYGEFERWTTAVVNSYVMPRASSYLKDVASVAAATGLRPRLEIMQSNGGVIPVDVAGAFPVRLAVSGPAGGVAGAMAMAEQVGERNLITLDMGGTSTDVGLVVGGRPVYGSQYTIEGYPLRMIGIDIRSIGAGGGSLARLDRMGALQVGPESAGAEPGPACYVAGGTEPTVTDADLVLGYLNARRFCNGERVLDSAAAAEAIDRVIASTLGVTVGEAALGILNVATTNMVGAVRKITTERGYDPRDFALAAFGGAGPVHAGLVAQELNISRVLILNQPGLLSAKGLLLSDYRTDVYRTFLGLLEELDLDAVNRAFADAEKQGLDHLSAAQDQVVAFTQSRILEMCYEGQQHVIAVPVDGPLTRAHISELSRRLDQAFRDVYGFLPQRRVPQVLRIRVVLEGAVARTPMAYRPPYGKEAASVGWREAVFAETGRVRVDVYDRETLPIGRPLRGPCIIEEPYSTTVVYPGQNAEVDGAGNIQIVLDEGGMATRRVGSDAAFHV